MSAEPKKLPRAEDVALILSDMEGRFWEEVQEVGIDQLASASSKEIGLLLMKLGLVMCLTSLEEKIKKGSEKPTPPAHAVDRDDAR